MSLLDRIAPARRWIPAAVLLLGLLAAWAASVPLHRADAARRDEQFERLADDIVAAVRTHMSGCEQALRAGALVASGDTVLDDWHWQATGRQLDIGTVESCASALAFFGAAPGAPRALVAPDSAVSAALAGFDPWHDKAHRRAMEQARDSGMPQLSEPGSWPTGAPGEAIVVWYMAAFDRDGATSLAAPRAGDKLRGYVAVPLSVEHLLRPLRVQYPEWKIALLDGLSPAHDDDPHPAEVDGTASGRAHAEAHHRGLRALAMGGRWWTIDIDRVGETALPPWQQPGTVLLASGAAISVLAAWATWLLLRVSRRAQALAHDYSAQARAGEARLRSVLDGARDGIFTLDLRGNLLGVNQAGLQMLGYSELELVGRNVTGLFTAVEVATNRARWIDFIHRARDSGDMRGPVHEITLLRADGTPLLVRSSLNLVRIDDEETVVWLIGDLSHERDIERRASEAQALNDLIMDVIPLSVITIDRDLTILSANRASHDMLGYGQGDLVGRPALSLTDPLEVHERAARLSAECGEQVEPGPRLFNAPRGANGQFTETEWTYVRKDGSRFAAAIIDVPLQDRDGRALGGLRVSMDITERKRAAARIEHLALHDGLTGLPNRRLLEDRVSQAVLRAQRQHSGFTLMLMDLDRFKQINDTLGHPVGDEVLKIVAQRLSGAVRASDTVVRMGGDEFAVLLPDLDDPARAGEVAGKLLGAMNDLFVIDSHRLVVTPSIGVALFPEHGEDLATLLKNADRAMYDAKERGRNTVSVFAQEMARSSSLQLALEVDLRHALERGEFLLHYQPLVDAASGEVHGLEALLRWHHPQRGLVSPGDFIPLAEETGLITPIGAWALQRACADLRRLHDAGYTQLRMAVNLSPRQFASEHLVTHVREALRDNDIDGRALELEITESALMESVERTGRCMMELRRMGCSIAIDDFGTGYSSLAYLARFPVQTVKIDRSFVREIDSGDGTAVLAGAIVAMAHSLGLTVVAEGVETEAQHAHLLDLRCETLQGFRFSRPVPVEELPLTIERVRRMPAVVSEVNMEVWAPTQGLWMSHTRF